MKSKVKAYLIVFEDGTTGLRYFCDSHYKAACGFHQIQHMSLIYSDIYDKKCCLCRKR